MKTTELRWRKRSVRKVVLTGVHRSWHSTDGRFRVVKSVSSFKQPVIWYAVEIDPDGSERLLGQHRTRQAAKRRCRERLAQNSRRSA